MSSPITKPLGRKAYGSIGHLPCSRMGPGDHAVPVGMANVCTKKTRDRHDRVIVQEKLDGSCVAVALVGGMLSPLGRAGWPAISSRYFQHRLFHDWVMLNADRFWAVLREGERVVGEWLAQAHGTRYDLAGRDPFVAFDLMVDDRRLCYDDFIRRLALDEAGQSRLKPLTPPPLVADVRGPVPLEQALSELSDRGRYGALESIEGVMYRVERRGEVDFLAKYVRPDKIDGSYLPELSGREVVWNWQPG